MEQACKCPIKRMKGDNKVCY